MSNRKRPLQGLMGAPPPVTTYLHHQVQVLMYECLCTDFTETFLMNTFKKDFREIIIQQTNIFTCADFTEIYDIKTQFSTILFLI